MEGVSLAADLSVLARNPGPLLRGGALLLSAALAWAVARFFLRGLRVAGDRTESTTAGTVLEPCYRPVEALVPLLVVNAALPATELPAAAAAVAGRVLTLLLIAGLAWLTIALLRVGQSLFLARFDTDARDNLRARKVHTQVDIVRKILVVGVVVIAVSGGLLQFDRLQEIGAGLLASAGLAGLVLGFAAQRTLGNLLAGFQLALTQPIRIDDVLVVEGEWGRVEEITLTYVVVCIWDRRRLVLPISYFIEKPFQNWTRTSASILGTVHVQVDYTVPVEEVRTRLGELVESSEYWDGEVWRLHVTDSSDRTLELRALMSAEDSPSAWELRCEVREELVAWLQEEYPESLPRVRAEVDRT